jgi:hypothetical protein
MHNQTLWRNMRVLADEERERAISKCRSWNALAGFDHEFAHLIMIDQLAVAGRGYFREK